MAMTPAAKHTRIASALRQLIRSGQFPPGSPLPSESELAARFGVARNTLRRALAALGRDGLVIVVPGRGRLVCAPGHSSADTSGLLPAYRRIAAGLRNEIDNGTHAPGGRLPSEMTLARRHGVSRETARRALAELQAAGLATVVHGKGWFVRRDAAALSGTSQDVPPHVS
jgi:DNA-binding GntR family transcriptional regulator